MSLGDFPLRTFVAVTDIERAAAFYESRLALERVRSGPSAAIADGSRVYRTAGDVHLFVYQSPTAGTARSTVAAWFVTDIDAVVADLTSAGVRFERYDGLEHDALGITARAGGGRIAWFRDPDGNTFAIESDD